MPCILFIYNPQDMRKMGGLVNLLPFTYTMVLIGSISLMALPFLTGLYSKEIIITLSYGQYTFSGLFCFWLLSISAIFTSLYSIRLLFLTFFGYPNGPRFNYIETHEASLSIVIPLLILAFLSIFFGYFASDLFKGAGSDFFGNSLFVHPNHSIFFDTEYGVPLFYHLLPLLGSLLGGFLTLFLYNFFPLLFILLINSFFYRALYRFFNQKYFVDNLYTNFFINPALNFGYITGKLLDRGVFETIGPFGIIQMFITISNRIISIDTGFLPQYALYIFMGSLGLMVVIMNFPDPRYILFYLMTIFFI
jgi:NADH-ubiquinone oxidoreductase chain 5